MESKLKAVRRGHRGQVTKLFKKFDEIENNSDLDKDDVKLISDAIEQKQRTIVDLNEKILDLTSDEDVAEEIQESDEYMFNLESKLRKIRKIYSDSISQNVASTSLDPNANSFMPSYPTNSSLTNANVIRSNETEINVQPTNFDNFRSMQNTHRDLQSTNNFTDIEESSTADNAIDNQQGIHQIVQITRYSTLSKLLRITAYLLRFIRNCRSPILQRNKAKYVSREELQDATECWILNCQRTSFKDEMLYLKLKDTKPTVLVRQLRLYLNNKDAICCGGRIHNAPVCENTKFPYLLPRSHPFTKLVVLDIHKYMKHSGVLSTVTQIRQTYWIPRIRQYVRGILRNCVICRKINSKPYTAPDPPLLPKV
ncbi:unnamed protein product [Mytilus edulis]|uniref:Integrase zinc-binding domain-containing protein n=1 Tax=Mytilus edulis TaxID=6550 RepID=A0A8S3RIZ2_MYTED|nr:unnamed protein product [Mytilus edulis]